MPTNTDPDYYCQISSIDNATKADSYTYTTTYNTLPFGWSQQSIRAGETIRVNSGGFVEWAKHNYGNYKQSSICGTEIHTNEKQGGNMKLYQIHAVNPQTEQMIVDEKVIAASKEEVILNSKLNAVLTELKLKLSDVDYFIYEIGTLRAKKEVQEVKIVKE